MKVAVLSDIHGNHIALKKCIEEIECRNIKALIFLGDYVGELAYPQKTMAYIRELMQEYECYFVRGNKEDYWIEREQNECVEWREGDSTTGALWYTYSNLKEEDIAFFKSLSHMEKICFKNLPAISAYHGSHDAKGDKLPLNIDNAHLLFEDAKESVILCGHTHIQAEIRQEGRILLNPGSVGAPLKSHGLSQFLILSENERQWQHEFVDIDYDIQAVIKELHEEKLYEKAPCWTKITEKLLLTGEIAHGEVLGKAMELLYNDTGKWCWPDIPEAYWKKAVEQLI